MLQYIHRQLHNIKWTSCSDVLRPCLAHSTRLCIAQLPFEALNPLALCQELAARRCLEEWFSKNPTQHQRLEGKIRRSWRSQALFFLVHPQPLNIIRSSLGLSKHVDTVHNVQNLRKRPCVPPMHSDLLAIPPGRSFIMERWLRHLKDPFDIAWWCMIGLGLRIPSGKLR